LLADWLLTPAAQDMLLARHAAVDELRDMLDLREDLAVLGEDVRSGVHPEELASWGSEPPILESRRMRIVAFLIPCLLVAGAALWAALGFRDLFIVMFALEMIFIARYRRAVARVVEAVEQPARDLALLAQVLGRLERERFQAPLLVKLRTA